jgi:hypothetical protein
VASALLCLFSRNFILVYKIVEIEDSSGEKGTICRMISRTDYDVERDMFALAVAASTKRQQLTAEQHERIFGPNV